MPEPTSDQRKPHARMDLTQGPIARTLLMFSLPVLGTSVLQSRHDWMRKRPSAPDVQNHAVASVTSGNGLALTSGM